MKDIGVYFPGFTRKAISFTIDDGNVPLDTKFLSIVRPAGILGTFNIVGNLLKERRIPYSDIRKLYKGYEIANHCNKHPFALNQDVNYEVLEENDEIIPVRHRIHKTEQEGYYSYYYAKGDKVLKARIVDAKTYIELIKEGKSDTEEIFGEGTVKGFVWPYGEQNNDEILEYLKSAGYESVRKTGCTSFDLPSDRMHWSYSANHENMKEKAEEFEKLADDGKLKWLCFGVHSHDFENNNCWDVLENFADKYGNRPADFWYATVHDIFAYEDAAKALVYTDTEIINNSDITLYLTVNGKRTTLMPECKIEVKKL